MHVPVHARTCMCILHAHVVCTNNTILYSTFILLLGTTSADYAHEHSLDTGSEHAVSTPPSSVPIERSFSSASKHYLSLSRLNSIFPVSRSSSESSGPAVSRNRVDAIQCSIAQMERVCVHAHMYTRLCGSSHPVYTCS